MQRIAIALLAGSISLVVSAMAADVEWTHLSSVKGELPVPGTSRQQTGALPIRIDKQSPGTDFVLSFRQAAPALLWYRRVGASWKRYVIEKEFLTVEAGGAACDVDRDGDLDIIFGGDWQSKELWWWENPSPNFDPQVSWRRHIIKSGGASQHHDQVCADVEGLGRPQVVYWNQNAKTLFVARIPDDPTNQSEWHSTPIFAGAAGEGVKQAALYAEGADAFDVDGDGNLDVLAGNYWFKYTGNGHFKATQVGAIGGRIHAGRFKPGKYGQIVIAPGDGTGPLMLYEYHGDPTDPKSWTGRDLLGRPMVHGHTLEVGDIDDDGNLDIFAAEMAQWHEDQKEPDNAKATAWILYGDGKGSFRTTVFTTGQDWHEGKLADLDGDGDLDIVNKPYNWHAPRIDVWLNEGTAKNRTKR